MDNKITGTRRLKNGTMRVDFEDGTVVWLVPDDLRTKFMPFILMTPTGERIAATQYVDMLGDDVLGRATVAVKGLKP